MSDVPEEVAPLWDRPPSIDGALLIPAVESLEIRRTGVTGPGAGVTVRPHHPLLGVGVTGGEEPGSRGAGPAQQKNMPAQHEVGVLKYHNIYNAPFNSEGGRRNFVASKVKRIVSAEGPYTKQTKKQNRITAS